MCVSGSDKICCWFVEIEHLFALPFDLGIKNIFMPGWWGLGGGGGGRVGCVSLLLSSRILAMKCSFFYWEG